MNTFLVNTIILTSCYGIANLSYLSYNYINKYFFTSKIDAGIQTDFTSAIRENIYTQADIYKDRIETMNIMADCNNQKLDHITKNINTNNQDILNQFSTFNNGVAVVDNINQSSPIELLNIETQTSPIQLVNNFTQTNPLQLPNNIIDALKNMNKIAANTGDSLKNVLHNLNTNTLTINETLSP